MPHGQMKERGPGVRGYPFVMALILSFAVFGLAVILLRMQLHYAWACLWAQAEIG